MFITVTFKVPIIDICVFNDGASMGVAIAGVAMLKQLSEAKIITIFINHLLPMRSQGTCQPQSPMIGLKSIE